MQLSINWFIKNHLKKSVNDLFLTTNEIISKKLKLSKKWIYEVNLVNNQKIKEINYKYRKKNQPTDVISFAFHDNNELKTNLIGEIYISFDIAKKQAYDDQVSLQERLADLLIHGILHLLKYSHDNESDAKKMFAIQNSIINSLKTIKLIKS